MKSRKSAAQNPAKKVFGNMILLLTPNMRNKFYEKENIFAIHPVFTSANNQQTEFFHYTER